MKDRFVNALPIVMLGVHILLLLTIWPLSIYLDDITPVARTSDLSIPVVNDLGIDRSVWIGIFLLGVVIVVVYIPTFWISIIIWGLRRIVKAESPLYQTVALILGSLSIVCVFVWIILLMLFLR